MKTTFKTMIALCAIILISQNSVMAEKKKKEVKKLEVRMDKEKQCNRKVERNAELRSLNNEIEQLKHGAKV